MNIDELSIVESRYDQPHHFSPIRAWNGRVVVIQEKSELGETLSSHFKDLNTAVCAESHSSQSVGGSAKGSTDSEGKSQVTIEAHHSKTTFDDRGISNTITTSAPVNVVNQGKTNAEGRINSK